MKLSARSLPSLALTFVFSFRRALRTNSSRHGTTFVTVGTRLRNTPTCYVRFLLNGCLSVRTTSCTAFCDDPTNRRTSRSSPQSKDRACHIPWEVCPRVLQRKAAINYMEPSLAQHTMTTDDLNVSSHWLSGLLKKPGGISSKRGDHLLSSRVAQGKVAYR